MIKDLGKLVSAVALLAFTIGQPQTSIAVDTQDCEADGKSLAKNVIAFDSKAKLAGYDRYRQFQPIVRPSNPEYLECLKRVFHRETDNAFKYERYGEGQDYLIFLIIEPMN